MTIRFGTDGWRGIIAEDYTFDNVRACAQGVANHLQEKGLSQRGLVVGYDTRFASEDFAGEVALVSAANGVKLYLCDRAAPTPVVSYNVLHRHAGGAVIITASHNPGRWNGFKYKPEYAGSASTEIEKSLEQRANHALNTGAIKRVALQEAKKTGLLHLVNPAPSYLKHISQLLDLKVIRRAGLKIAVDSMYGAGIGYLRTILDGDATKVEEIHGERNPTFPGMAQPEPIARNLGALSKAVVRSGAAVGLALDGDADRLGVVDEKGRFITPLQTFSLLALYLLEVRGERGPLIKSLTMSSMAFRLGECFGVPVIETPVGFKYLGEAMIREKALMAGEESGGFGFRGHVPERDGIVSGLFFLDMMVRTGKTPSQLVDYLYRKVGPHFYEREDVHLAPSQRENIETALQRQAPPIMAGLRVRQLDRTDGYRFMMEDGSWVALRFSGTEPLLRIYAEAPKKKAVKGLLTSAMILTGLKAP